ncbi:unnamed protein product [Boreogadus saida]
MTDMDMTAMTADYRVLSEDTAPTSSAADADAFDSLEDLSEEDMDFDDGDGTTCSDSEPDVPSPSLSDNIANWAVRFGISMVALTALLSILNITHPNLPKDVTVPMKEPVVIGAYCGPKKPSSATEFLSDFVTELKELEAGFSFGDKNLTIEQSPFYTYPFNSDRINIFVVNHASDELKSVEVSALRQKCVALPYRDGFVAIPLLH